MIWITFIGLALCLLSVWLWKNSRENGKPILRMWAVIGLVASGILPVWGAFLGLSVAITWVVAIASGEISWNSKTNTNKFAQFMGRYVS